ncbi:MAG: tetratricopeptide repeat protein [Candidatus Dormibacteraeota bacterium]|nr:tetratricopeptide repeat protein [Candidatus Dormibacteraeota bacterium]
MEVDPRQALLACAGDPRADIAEGALWLAAEDCAEVDVDGALRAIDTLAADLGHRLNGARGSEAISIIHALLRERVGLRRSGGGDPRAHYLHLVLQRGAGIPISCAVLWMAVGRRAGLRVEGIGLPGHFGVRVDGVLAEPADGELLDEPAAQRLVAAATGNDPGALQPAWLLPATARLMLARMSRNLRGCYSSLERWDMAVRAADRCVALFPDEPTERRDRGLLLWRTGHNGAALADLRHYLDNMPADAPDRSAVEEVACRLRAALN